MKLPNRIRAAAAIAAATLLLAGCTASGGGAADGGDTAATESNGALAMSFPSQGNSYWTTILGEMKTLAEEAGYELLTDDPQGQIEAQVNGWRTWITRGDVKAIMGLPIQPDAIVPVTQEANDAGIPVVGFVVPWEGTAATVGIDFIEHAAIAGKSAGEWILENRGDEPTKVALVGNTDNDAGRAFNSGYIKGLEESGANVEIFELGNGGRTRDDGYNAAQTHIVAHPDTYVWLGQGASEALGARQAIIDSGISPTDAKFFVSAAAIDQEALDTIAKGDILREAWYIPSAVFAKANIDTMIAAANGKLTETMVMLEATRATQANAGSLAP